MSNRRRTRPPSGSARRAMSPAQRSPEADETLPACDCPACTGPEMDLDDVAEVVDLLLGDQFPISHAIDAELGLGVVLRAGDTVGADRAEWHATVLSRLLATGTAKAAGLIAALSALSEGQARANALAALESEPAAPDWAAPLTEPLAAVRCLRLEDRDGDAWALASEFSRGADRHAFVLITEPDECGAAMDLALCEPAKLPRYLRAVKKAAAEQHYRLKEITLNPAEFRVQAEAAMAERLRHDVYELVNDYDADEGDEVGARADQAEDDDEAEYPLDDESPDYYALAPVFQARLRMLPAPSERELPADALAPDEVEQAPHPDQLTLFPELDYLASVAGGSGGSSPRASVAGRTLEERRDRQADSPARKARGTAPVLRLRVDIKGARPPIWRRLEVPADMTLAGLHDVLQTAFGWTDDHLHVFETGRGSFGQPGTSLGHRSDAKITIEQVAAQAGDKINYTYDFGDNWEHVITVEQVLPHQAGVAYPRCTGGRRAGPPEDCGGVWGYDWLLAVLRDPAHEDHDDRLDWLGITRAGQFDPEGFDPGQVTKALSARFG